MDIIVVDLFQSKKVQKLIWNPSASVFYSIKDNANNYHIYFMWVYKCVHMYFLALLVVSWNSLKK